MREIPNLGIGGKFASRQPRGTILQVQRTSPQVQPTREFIDKRLQQNRGIGVNRRTGEVTHVCGVEIVEVFPRRSIPLKNRFPIPGRCIGNMTQIGRTPVEPRHTEADFGGFITGANIIVGDGEYPGAFTGSLAGFDQTFGCVDAGDDYIHVGVDKFLRHQAGLP